MTPPPESMELDAELLAPPPNPQSAIRDPQSPRSFRGTDLWPLTSGSDLLLIQARTVNEDSRVYEALAFIFIHLKRGMDKFGADRLYVARLLWDIDAFRAALLDWMDDLNLTAADRREAIRIYDEVLKEKAESEIEVAPAESSSDTAGAAADKKKA